MFSVEMLSVSGKLSPLGPMVSALSEEGVTRKVVEWPAVVDSDMLSAMSRFAPLYCRELKASSVQLLLNRVRPDFDINTMYLYPLIVVLPRADAELPLASPVTLPELQSPATEDIQDESAEQWVATISSADRSLSITGYAANMDLMTMPLSHSRHDNGADGSGSASGAHRDVPGPNMSILYMICICFKATPPPLLMTMVGRNKCL